MSLADDLERDKRPGLGIMPGAAPMGTPMGAPAPSLGAPSAGGHVSAAPAASPSAPHAHGTGFVGLESYLNANRGLGSQMAGKVAQTVGAEGQKAQSELNAYDAMANGGRGSSAASYAEVNPEAYAKAQTDASKAASDASLAGSPGGLGALLTQQYGTGGGYGSGMRGFDSFLSRAEGGSRLDALGQQYGNLGGYLGLQAKSYHPTPAPSAGGGPGNPKNKMGPGIMYKPGPATSGPTGGGLGGGMGFNDPRRRRRMA